MLSICLKGINVQDIRARRLAKLSAERKLEQFQQSVYKSSNSTGVVRHLYADEVSKCNARGDLMRPDLVSTTKEDDIINEVINKPSNIKCSKATDAVRRRPRFYNSSNLFHLKEKDDFCVECTLMEKKEIKPNESERNNIEAKQEQHSDNEDADVLIDLLATTQKCCSRKDCNSSGDHIEEVEDNVLTVTTADTRKASRNSDLTDKEHKPTQGQ